MLSVRPGKGEGTLLVATGAGNDVKVNIAGYKFVVLVTWCTDYNSNPSWFCHLLVAVAKCFCEPHDEVLDAHTHIFLCALMCRQFERQFRLGLG